MKPALRISRSRGFYQISASAVPEDWQQIVGQAETVQKIEDLEGWPPYNAAYQVLIDGWSLCYFVADSVAPGKADKCSETADPVPRKEIKHHPQPVEVLECCACGLPTRGRQWWNRDTGYGLCARCGTEIAAREGPQMALEMGGERGIHWDVDGAGEEHSDGK